MYEDGICEVEEGMFSSCICFEDTSYHSVREDAQKAVFTSICRLYDQFGADTLVQFNIINTPLLKEQIGHRKFFNPSSQLNVNAANDAAVFNEILNEKMRQGVSNIRRKMYITFSVSAPTVDDAVPKLARIENQISQILTSIGSKSHVLDGAERLALLNSQLNPLKPFNFDYRRDISARMVQTTKDCIAPMTLDFKPEGLADCFKTGDMWGQVLVIKKLGSELTDQALSDITELPIPLNVTWFAQPMDKAAAVAFTRQRLAWIDKEIIEEQRSAVQKGYDFSILPQELKYSKEETEDVIDNLQNKNQRLYVFTGLFYTYAPTKKQLDNQVLSIISAARQNSIEVSTYEYRQRQGFNSILPLGHNHCEISRMSTTAEVSILMPFATMELDDKGGNYYGQNKHSCPVHAVSNALMEKTILDQLDILAAKYKDGSLFSEIMDEESTIGIEIKRLKAELAQHKKKLVEYESGLKCLYLDKASGSISNSDYQFLSRELSAGKELAERKVDLCTENYNKILRSQEILREKAGVLESYSRPKELTRSMVETFIDHIVICSSSDGTSKQEIKIYWNF